MTDVNSTAERRGRSDQKFIQLLVDVKFGQRYFAFCDQRVGRKADPALTPADYEKVLADSGLTFKYHKGDRFFGHRDTRDGILFHLNVSVAQKNLELIFAFESQDWALGGPFPLLASRVQTLLNPAWDHQPPYPRVPFTTLEQFREAVGFGVELFHQMQALVLANTWE